MQATQTKRSPSQVAVAAAERAFLGTLTLQRQPYCFGCGCPLRGDAWHVVGDAAFCPTCPRIDYDGCKVSIVDSDRTAGCNVTLTERGIRWNAPREACYQGQSAFRIRLASEYAKHADHQTADWILAHPLVDSGPESIHNTPLPSVDNLARTVADAYQPCFLWAQYDG